MTTLNLVFIFGETLLIVGGLSLGISYERENVSGAMFSLLPIVIGFFAAISQIVGLK